MGISQGSIPYVPLSRSVGTVTKHTVTFTNQVQQTRGCAGIQGRQSTAGEEAAGGGFQKLVERGDFKASIEQNSSPN